EYNVLRLNAASWEVMKGQREVRLMRTAKREKAAKSRTAEINWENVDPGLFEELRQLRREIAAERQVPPYVVFGDATLRQLAQARRRGAGFAARRPPTPRVGAGGSGV